jgi:GT2 family glycosyltransferase
VTSELSGADPVVVTGVLVIHDGALWLRECLDALALQTRPLDRLVVIDTGSADESLRIVAKHARIRQVIFDVVTLSAPDESTFGEAVAFAVARTGAEQGPGAEWLWLLHDDSAAAPQALAELLDAARRSPSVGVAGPKLVSWDDPSRLLEVGAYITRSGRRVGGPEAGERDQGQHDHRYDVLGVSTSGMLIRREVFDLLGGFDPAFGRFRDDLDLCWRAQLAGHRVVVAPKARMREAAASINGQRSQGLTADAAVRRDRRYGRQVALARCSLYAAPFLAIWIAVASLGAAAALLVAKRPRRAWLELGDFGSLMNPGRPLAARWRSRGLRRVRRRDLRGLFASPRAGFGQTLDSIHDEVPAGFARGVDEDHAGVGSALSTESGPTSHDAEPLGRPAPGAGWRILRHPGFLAVAAGVLLAAVTWRSLLVALSPSGPGIAGGELLPVSGSSSGLWHAWLDGWHGAGLGNALEPAPYLPVLAAGAWVLEHLPMIDASSSPAGVSIAWLLGAAVPLSAWTAYLAARVLTRSPWPRAWAGLAWASLATLTTAVASGRLGGVVAHILLPLVAAGFVCAARRSASYSVIFGAALALAVAGAFNPAVAVLGAGAALVLLVAGHGRTRLRAAVLLLVPMGLLGPWLLQVADNPLLLLAGPGLTVWRDAGVAPWQLALLHPGGPGSYPVLLSAPIVLAGLIAISARSRRPADSTVMWVLAVVAVVGLALGMASSHVVIAHIPQDLAGAGGTITGWAGTGLDLAALALVAAALLGLNAGSGRLPPSRLSWRRPLVPLVVMAAVLGVVASMGMTGWLGVGEVLNRSSSDIPAVAAEQADGPWGARYLYLTREGDTIGYRLVGAEPGTVVRDLPTPVVVPDPLLAAAVRRAVGDTDATSPDAARKALADLGVGFVGFHGASTEPLVTQLDATAGMIRLSNNHSQILWRVARENTAGPSRLRLVGVKGEPVASIPVTGDHARTDVDLGPLTPADVGLAGRRLVVAEPPQWAEHARVRFAGHRLEAVAGADQPTYLVPSGAGRLSITIAPSHQRWRWAQLGLLGAVLFLAAPFSSTRTRRSP